MRMQQLQDWLQGVTFSQLPLQLKPLTNDASFRSYYRVLNSNQPLVVMDAPPEKEHCDAFIAISKGMLACGLNVPKVFASDLAQGFVLISDFGDQLFLHTLTENNKDILYPRALVELVKLQAHATLTDYPLPDFSDKLYQGEFNLSFDWYLKTHCQQTFTEKSQAELMRQYWQLVTAIKTQPQVIVHRDYHSRNLMILRDEKIGILDFQDAVRGPVTYDALSLLRDCYVDWPLETVRGWLQEFQREIVAQRIIKERSFELFETWFDYASLQRHIKCLGIFTRLQHLYKKPGYLDYLPRTLGYIQHVCQKHSLLNGFLKFFEKNT